MKALCLFVLLATSWVVATAEPIQQTITIHYEQNLGPADHHLVGLLHGISFDAAQDYSTATTLVRALRPSSWRLSGYGEVLDYVRQRFQTRLIFVLQDTFNERYSQHIQVGPGGQFQTYAELEQAWRQNLREVVGRLQGQHVAVAFYDIFAEPELGFKGLQPADFLRLLKASLEEIRRLDGRARFVAPSMSHFSEKALAGLFDYVHSQGLPLDALSWHELSYFSGEEKPILPHQLADHVAIARRLMREKLKKTIEIHINEYQWTEGYYSPGVTVGWLYYMTRCQVAQASRACWEFKSGRFSREWSSCWTSFCGLLTRDNLHPTAIYWVYRQYADMSGQLVDASTSDRRTVALASLDPVKQECRILLGRYGQDGPTTVKLTLPHCPLKHQPVRATLYRIPAPTGPDQPLPSPVQVFDRRQTVGTFVIENFANDEAYILTLLPP